MAVSVVPMSVSLVQERDRQNWGSRLHDQWPSRREAASLGPKITGTLGLLHDAAQRRWMSDDQCLVAVRTLCLTGFRIRLPGANETFAEYFQTFPSS